MTDYRKNFLDILTAKQHNNKAAVHEASLGRIMQHAQNSPEKGFAILTSWRQGFNRAQNLSRFAKLKGQVRSKGLGFNVLVGHWRECQDPALPYDQCPPEQLVDATEPSLFIVGISLDDAKALGNAYEQDAIVFAGPETQGAVNLIFKDGGTMPIGSFNPMAIAQAYSELRGGKNKAKRHFKFESIEWPTQGQTEALLEQSFKRLVPF